MEHSPTEFYILNTMKEWMNKILYSACIQPEAVQSAEHREYPSKACYHSNSNSVSWEIYSWAANGAHQAIFHSKRIPLMCQVLTHSWFSGVSPDGNCA